MRFNIQLIADWILDYLFRTKRVLDADLHWECVNHFMTRDEIMTNGNSMGVFSRNYESAIEGLKGSGYIFHSDEDKVIVYSEVEKRDIRDIRVQATTKQKISCFYIAEFDIGCKVGITCNLKARITEYSKPWSRTLFSFSIVEGEEIKSIEDHLKHCFLHYRVTGSTEFFALSKDNIEKELMAFNPFMEIKSYEPAKIDAQIQIKETLPRLCKRNTL